MLSRNLLPASGLHMLGFVSYQDLTEIRIRSREPSSNCPSCGVASSRTHARYYRTVADLPWHGVVVRLRLHARKFKCLAPGCPRRIFSERLPAALAGCRWAAVAGRDALYGMARMFSTFSEGTCVRVAAFRDYEDARRWLAGYTPEK